MYKIRSTNALLLGIFILGLTACSTYQKVPYFRNIPADSSVYARGSMIPTVDYQALKIKPDDLLGITVSTLDNSTAILSDAGVRPQGAPGGAIASQPGNGFLVSAAGTVELPLLGSLQVAGYTTEQVKEWIRTKAAKYYKDPVVSVRLMNFKVTVLGEVARPGSYFINGEKATLLDALGLAGDLTIYGNRQNVLLLRDSGGKQKSVRFNLNDGQALTSPYLYLQQNDVVYIEPGKAKAAANNAGRTQTIAIVGSIVSVLIVALTRFR
ncbi:polysaccharide biosynthesis/export family protein [Niabella drilacis]|uniref:Polysaccharide export outer membrane protein n=1 Tax=Niabella drilacis (strain DSM 25811 / CCM 8410 / CCUG 62505 / LMG 26954 / E90) TaxID=1285928 RepID=A0A1G6LL59_NIADE|nr:polysaccharide biosynthesis/export family protein [Niabella drilacis]SDC43980.1 polysaccharide export outer membrane protein [Niabella drilacis]